MKSLTFIFISLLSGIIAGVILAGVNYFVAEPFIDQAIGIEVDNSIASGEVVDFDELSSYRVWQKEGTFAAGAFLGLTYGAILGIVYVISRKYLPSSDDRKKALILAAIMCLSLYVVPFIKYPANPPAVGDPETIGLRDSLYTNYQLASGLIALGVSILMYKLRRIGYSKYVIIVIYLGLVASIYAIFPANPDEITAPMELVNAFRAVTFGTMVMFYLVLGTIFGIMWNKFKPHETARITA
ncbi:putative cobalt transporter subunit (CbtA) [Candidatus Nitrosocosmicus oleophilus]|uniref:Putative cobalt transporter subunit (CbtA) n=1 Tax=Candidatus Nitrosocosmicus oleophilus TaxID=1353260 RepID=A0A654LVE0_9ARCH|nr:CbtA family protein [Candidatus Nitrosocosmicus oleophilus]ALI34283.1 putative cobalt transporter subunit (CbtA) [Candidatus Nitrosocosmicus oleophilus]